MFPTLFKIGPLEVHTYGLMLALSFVLGAQIALREGVRRGLSEAKLSALCLWILALAVIGARAVFVLTHAESYGGRWLDAFKLWEGGLTMYGGFVAALIGALVFVRRNALPVGQVFDAFQPRHRPRLRADPDRVLPERLLFRPALRSALGGHFRP